MKTTTGPTQIRRKITGPASIRVFITENFDKRLLKLEEILLWKGYYHILSYWEFFDGKRIKINTPSIDVYIKNQLINSIFIEDNKYYCYAYCSYVQRVKRIEDVLEIIERGF